MAVMSRRQARQWLREHFAHYVLNAEFASGDEPEGPGIDDVLADEKDRIARRILGCTSTKANGGDNG